MNAITQQGAFIFSPVVVRIGQKGTPIKPKDPLSELQTLITWPMAACERGFKEVPRARLTNHE